MAGNKAKQFTETTLTIPVVQYIRLCRFGCAGIQNTIMCWFIYYSQLHSVSGKNVTHYTTELNFSP